MRITFDCDSYERIWSIKMESHGNYGALVYYDDHSVFSRETEDRAVMVENKSPRPSGTNEYGEDNDTTLRQENSVHESDHADVDMPIGDYVDVFINAIVMISYANTGKNGCELRGR